MKDHEKQEYEKRIANLIAELHAEQSVMDDTLDMVGAPQCGDPFMPERITRVILLADQRDKALEELRVLKIMIESATMAYKAAGLEFPRIGGES